jgi:hypothetical protein
VPWSSATRTNRAGRYGAGARSAASQSCATPGSRFPGLKAHQICFLAGTRASITLTRCRNGYALLSAHPASGGESPNVFLVWRPAAGAWAAIDLGTGIDCAGSPLGPKLTAACKALGY